VIGFPCWCVCVETDRWDADITQPQGKQAQWQVNEQQIESCKEEGDNFDIK